MSTALSTAEQVKDGRVKGVLAIILTVVVIGIVAWAAPALAGQDKLVASESEFSSLTAEQQKVVHEIGVLNAPGDLGADPDLVALKALQNFCGDLYTGATDLKYVEVAVHSEHLNILVPPAVEASANDPNYVGRFLIAAEAHEVRLCDSLR